MFICPKCNMYGIEWDARRKILFCHYQSCNHSIKMPGQKEYPREDQIKEAINKNSRKISLHPYFTEYLMETKY